MTQPRPEGKGWEKCPTCNALGKKLIANSKIDGRSGSKKLRDSEEMPELDLYIQQLNFEKLSNQDNTYGKYEKYVEKEVMNNKINKINPGHSGQGFHFKKCRDCNGKGWIKRQY